MDPRDAVSTGFYEVVVQFAKTLSETWPTRFPKDIWPVERKLELLDRFANDYSHLFERAQRHDASIFEDPILEEYKDLVDPSSLTVFWQYSDHLVRFGSVYKMYGAIPTNVMGILGESIQDIKGKLEAGTLDPKYMNPLEIGQDVMKRLKPEDMQAMMSHLMSNQDQMMEMMSTVMGLMDKMK